MHKFTIFTIIFSIVVVITVGELVIHDYLERKSGAEEVEVEESTEEAVIEEEIAGEEEVVVEEEPVFEPVASMPGMDFVAFGFAEGAALTEKNFPETGMFSLLEYTSSASQGFYWELFEGEEYAGGIYEIVCENPTEAFTVYTDLRESGISKPDSGEVNETNSYGETSFYFNHSTKTTTVFLVVLSEDKVYGFTYSHKYHNAFKELFSII